MNYQLHNSTVANPGFKKLRLYTPSCYNYLYSAESVGVKEQNHTMKNYIYF